MMRKSLLQDMLSITSVMTGFINKTVVAWDAEAKKIRGTHEKERQLRQEQSEERIDGLFHDNEIGYSDIGALEAEFKKVEAEARSRGGRGAPEFRAKRIRSSNQQNPA
jgi:hypothetical protein